MYTLYTYVNLYVYKYIYHVFVCMHILRRNKIFLHKMYSLDITHIISSDIYREK